MGFTIEENRPLAHNLREAEIAREEGKLEEAIHYYRTHIAERLKDLTRPEWENPHFYLLFIGDMQLEQGNVDDAIKSYEQASKNNVEPNLVSDRFRYLANWHVTRGNPEQALEVLKKYRDYDPLLFDIAADRIARELVATQDARQTSEFAEAQNK